MSHDIVTQALIFATKAHGAQVRKYTGEPYITHTIEVMMIVRNHGGSDAMQAAALLHDVLEDTPVNYATLYQEFGEVARIVMELTEPDWQGNRKTRKQFECNRLATISPDAQTIKYADLLSNTKSIIERDPDFAKVYLAEKRAILAVMDKGNPELYRLAMEACE